MFQVISDRFFMPLASPNRKIYWECISKLFTVMNHQLSFGIDRDVLVEELQYYFEQEHAIEIEDEDIAGKNSRDKANWMLRRLEYYSWIEVETDKSYIQRVNFKDYAVKIIKTLLEIEEGKQIEYQGYIYVIYSLVRGNTDKPGTVLLSILENTDMLITGLKNLNSGIKRYIDDLTRYKTPSEIMDVLFNDYIENIVDKAYHRLLTSDNVAKFRPEIVERLESKSRSRAYIEKASAEIAAIQEISIEEAVERVYQYIHTIVDAFKNLDDILADINQKNTQYQRAAVNRAKFFLIGTEDVRGQIKELLSGINEEINKENMDLGGIYRISFIDELIRIYSSAFIDERSLYVPIEGRKEFKPEAIANEVPDMEIRQKKIRKMMERMERVLNPQKINQYVLQCMKEKECMQASELPLDMPEDFVRIIYIRLYGQRKNMKYTIESGEDITVKGYRFRDYSIRKKEH